MGVAIPVCQYGSSQGFTLGVDIMSVSRVRLRVLCFVVYDFYNQSSRFHGLRNHVGQNLGDMTNDSVAGEGGSFHMLPNPPLFFVS